MNPPFPNPDCAHPSRYSWRDNYATEHQVIDLIRGFVRALQPDYVVETGTYLGDTARAIGETLVENGHGRLDTIETNRDRAEAARENLVGLPVTVHQCSSLDFTPREGIGFAWFDSAPNDRAREFRAYRDFMLPGCVVGFHDTSARHKVRPQVEALEEEGLLKAIYLPTWRGVAFATV